MVFGQRLMRTEPESMTGVRESLKTTALVLGGYLVLAAVVYSDSISGWFLSDEIIVFSEISQLSLPEVLRSGGFFGNFVPALYVSLWFDWHLFDLEPAGYHIHSIISVSVAATLVFWLMRGFCTKLVSLFSGACFLMLPPTVAVTSWVCTRHYLEGTIPALAGAILIARYVERPSWRTSSLAGLMYFLACLSKEIFAVLPAALAFLPVARSESDAFDRTKEPGITVSRRLNMRWLTVRLQLVTPLAIAAVTYLSWRSVAVDQLFIKKGFSQSVPEMVGYFIQAWPRYSGWMFEPTRKAMMPWVGLIVATALIIVIVGVLLLKRGPSVAAFAVTLFIAAALPSAMVLNSPKVAFLTVANHYCLRFIYLPAVILLLFGVYALSRLPSRKAAVIGMAVLFLTIAFNGPRQTRPWINDGKITRGAADVYRQWWNRPAVIASDVPLSLHVGLRKLWIAEEGQPEILARVISTRNRKPRQSIRVDDAYLAEPGITFVEDLQWKKTTRILDRKAFLDRYAVPTQ